MSSLQGLRFEVVPSRFNEKLSKASFRTPYEYAIETAKQKALDVARRIHQKDLRAPDVVIGADTIVTVEGLILEKPIDKQDAYHMLSRLNGKEHSVFTGVVIIHCFSQGGQLELEISHFYEETMVTFAQLSEELLWEYIHSGEPMDKAGGYGIQALGGMLVESIRGDFLNVAGFPLNHFCKKLAELYRLPGAEGLRRGKHSSGPTAETSESLREEGRAGPDRGGAQAEGGDPARAPGTRDAHRNWTAESLPPFPAGLLELIVGFKASKALFTACKLKVFDVLKDEAPLKAVDVASKIDASERGTGWLLDICVALGLLDKTERGYSNSELATRYLLSDGEFSLHGFIELNDNHSWAAFSQLESAVREGSSPDQWAVGESLLQDSCPGPDARLCLMKAKHGLAKLTARQVATAFDLSRFSSACDLGGCTGALAHELARENPGLKVTVFDLPGVTEHVTCFQPMGRQTKQVSFVPGNFFKDSLPEADLYILSGILHDWPDEKVHDLLSRVSGSCKPGGGLLVAEVALDEDTQAARPGLLRSLNRLLHTQGGERGLSQYRQLLQAHGFTDVQVARTGDIVDVVLATRPAP
ncbi:PREDICTED: N-acetylserotonin O-methyltransferase-like protein [Hipposideros armiger]|uniref:N-acetylserotonin O-methyltransferase-like protein n=1 Tax=Hipposideros armiger TaxID=186990 RepID=A0A8B7QER6_HIPAR|nr:PREDICTED: N-acetylserotonin O-methyltransferase-like protein [Hipposideros armiger]